jgi:hypothetical protein
VASHAAQYAIAIAPYELFVWNLNGSRMGVIRFDALKPEIDLDELFLKPRLVGWELRFELGIVVNASRHGAAEV